MGQTGLEKAKTVLRVTSGNFLEMYDFFLFGIYARQIAQTFFPSDDPYASLMATFLSLRRGLRCVRSARWRWGPTSTASAGAKALFSRSRSWPAAPSSSPSCRATRPSACWPRSLVVLGRLLQGFSAGVELGGVSVYLSEMATPGNKGFYVSWQSASQQVAVVFAALLGYAIANSMAPAKRPSGWGWRIPFFIGCAIVPFLYMIRRRLEETPEFAAPKVHPTTAQIFAHAGANWPIVLGGVAMVMMTTVSFYLITVYTPTFGRSVLKLTDSTRSLVTMCGRGVEFRLAAVLGARYRIGSAASRSSSLSPFSPF